MDFVPFAPFEKRRPGIETSRYRIEGLIDGEWRKLAGKTAKLEDVIEHCTAAYSCAVRIVDQRKDTVVCELKVDQQRNED